MIRSNHATLLSATLFLASMLSLAWPMSPQAQGQVAAPAAPPVIRAAQDPALTALLESNPQTPAELFRIVLLLIEIDHPNEAKPLVARLIAATPDAATMAAILRTDGNFSLLRLSESKELGDDGKKLAEMIRAGAAEHRGDAARISKLIERLGDPAAEVRHTAIVDLAETADAGMSALIATLADSKQAGQHRAIQTALVEIGAASIDPLISSLQADDDAFRVRVVETLGASETRRAALYLVAPFVAPDSSEALRQTAQEALLALIGKTPSRDAAEHLLQREARIHLEQRRRFVTELDDSVRIWRWDSQTKTVVRDRYPQDVLQAVVASRFSRDLFRVNPENAANRQLYLLSLLQAAQLTGRVDEIAAEAKKLGVPAIDQALSEAIKSGHVAAATAAARLLGTMGSARLLAGASEQNAPLVRAARHPNARLRFAAVEAIMKLGPTKAYAGSSHVLEAIAFFASSGGVRRVLVVDPRTNKAANLAGVLKDAGFEAEIATTGCRCQRLLRSSADYAFVMIDMGIDGPRVDKLTQQIRRDLRSSRLPIGLLSSGKQLDRRAARIAFDDPLTEAFPWPVEAKSVDYQMRRLLTFVARRSADADERITRARRSLGWMGQLSAQPQALYDVSRHQKVAERGLVVPELSAAAATVLGNLGTHHAQSLLVELASGAARPLAMRQSAAAAFAKSVGRYGIQLTSGEILQQYDHYNASRNLDKATQNLLGSILDTLESRTGEMTTNRPVSAKKSVPAKTEQ